MEKTPKVPHDVIEELKLKDAKPVSMNVKLLYDGKQFSIKIPARISEILNLKQQGSFELTVKEPDTIILKQKR